jgi:nitrite reductase/ring-hydroxylating ferredoxin subunit
VQIVDVADEPVLVLDGADTAIGARCSHLGGPLADGEVHDGCVTCPWHASVFDLLDGSVVHGPATAPQPAYEVDRRRGPQPWLRARR